MICVPKTFGSVCCFILVEAILELNFGHVENKIIIIIK